MKNVMSKKDIKNITLLIIILTLIIGVLCYLYITIKPNLGLLKLNKKSEEQTIQENIPSVLVPELKEEYCDTLCYLNENRETIDFLSKTVGINSEEVVDNLVDINSAAIVDEHNIGRVTDGNGNLLDYGSLEKGLVEYLLQYAEKHPSSVNNTIVPYNGDAKYVEDLIKYFTQIYNNVDYLTAVSIGAAESGYYKVKYMLNSNNIYGGMSSSGLIKHKTIEYGTLSYVRMLSRNYYGKGLTTKESIGYVYCPTVNEAGQKIASPHWLNLVNKAMAYYQDSEEEVTVSKLINS